MTTYIASVNSEGEISSIWTSGAIPSPAEGTNPDNQLETIVWVNQVVPDLTNFSETKYYKDNAWVDREVKPAEYYNWKDEAWVLDSPALYTKLRAQRNRKLYACDWTQTADSPLTDEKKAEWASYRQALRDVPSNNSGSTGLDQVIWPDQPS